MSAKIICPNGHPIAVRDEHAGRRVKCPACGAAVQAPAAAPAPLPPAPPPAAAEVVEYDPSADSKKHETSPRKAKRERKAQGTKHANFLPAVWIIIGVTGFGVVALGVVVWIFLLGPWLEHLSFPSSNPGPHPSGAADIFHRQVEILRQKYGEERVVFVCIKGVPREMGSTVSERLRSYGFEYAGGGRFGSSRSPKDLDFQWVVVAPVPDVNALAKQIDFGRVVSVRVSRINVVADLSKFEGVLPETADPVTRLLSLAKATSNDPHTRMEALLQLKEIRPDHRRAEVARELEKLLEDTVAPHVIPGKAAQALGYWGGPENVPALIRALEGKHHSFTMAPAAIALTRLKDERAIEPLAKLVKHGFAADALREFGAAAEPALVGCLKDPDRGVREQACILLRDIGSAKSVPALEVVANEAHGRTAGLAKEALEAIRRRTGGAGK